MERCIDCKSFVRGDCSRTPGIHDPNHTTCGMFEPALEPGMRQALVERLLCVALCGLFSVVCVAQSFKAALSHHRVLFAVAAVFFAFASGHELARNSNSERGN